MRLSQFILLPLLFISTTLFAQEKSSKRFSAGFSVGTIVYGQIADEKLEDPLNSHFGSAFYGNIFYKLSDRIELGLGVGVRSINLNQIDYSPLLPCDSQDGKTDIFNSFFDTKYKNVFLSVPLDVKIKLSKSANHFYINTGVEASYQVVEQSFNTLHECGVASENFWIPSSTAYFEATTPRKYYTMLRLGGGYQFLMDNGRRIFIEMVPEIALNKTYETPELNLLESNSRLYGVGLKVGFRF